MPSSDPLEIAVLLVPRFSLMALSAVLEPFRIANRLAERPLYRWRFVSPTGGVIEASSGLPITALPSSARTGSSFLQSPFRPVTSPPA